MRKYLFGVETTEKGASFRVWAPKCKEVEVVLENKSYHLEADKNGFFYKEIRGIPVNTLYQFRLDGKKFLFPDPASRFQPKGPHGPSQIIDLKDFQWTDKNWRGIPSNAQVILYEMHIGTFTQEGTWASASKKLQYLADLGINVIEMMPIADFCGEFNWGYDGVNLFSPTRNYGHPDDLCNFINQAHELEISVILDVVYNHFGPEGNYLSEFSDHYLKEEDTEWGKAINFDGEGSEQVRAYFIENAGYWIEEFHFDGVRIDACHAIQDTSNPHILAEITQQIRKKGGSKKTYVIAENEQQQIKAILPINENGFGMDAVWNEDFHHSAFVRLTGRNEAYFQDYLGKAQEFVSSIKHGFLYQGQWYSWQKKKRGSVSLGIRPTAFVNFIENHDQVANSGGSLRLCHFSQPGAYRAMVALYLLSPQTPLIFQGQEFGAKTPFFFFSNLSEEIAKKVYEGRMKFLSQFKSFNDPEIQSLLPDPSSYETFSKSKLNWKEKNNFILTLFCDLIKLRKKDSIFSMIDKVKIDGAILNDNAFIIRYMSESDARLLLINFGADFHMDPSPEPLLAPLNNQLWDILWSSERPAYGSFGMHRIPPEKNGYLAGYSALILYPQKREQNDA